MNIITQYMKTAGGKVVRLGFKAALSLPVVVATEILCNPSTCYAAEIPKDWRVGGVEWWGKQKGKCECQEFHQAIIVPSWWAMFSDVEKQARIGIGPWVDFGEMTVDECKAMERDAVEIVSQTSTIGFTIYNVSGYRCRFNGVLYGNPFPGNSPSNEVKIKVQCVR